jgi:hypothetical protein
MTREILFTVGFRSRWFHRGKVCINWTDEALDGPHHAVKKSSRVVGPTLALVAFPIDFSSHGLIFPKKNMMWQKDWVCLTSRRSVKVKNMQNQGNLLHGVKTKWKGVV